MLFDGKLPDLNLGSYRGASADPELVNDAMRALKSNPTFSTVLDGRFQGGYITRHYGQPERGFHTLQLEMSQSIYMSEEQLRFDETRSKMVMPVLRDLIESLINWSPQHA